MQQLNPHSLASSSVANGIDSRASAWAQMIFKPSRDGLIEDGDFAPK